LSTLVPPKYAGAFASDPDIVIFPILDPVPVYINVSVKFAPSIPVTSVLIVVVVANTLPSASSIVNTLVNVSA
jgi:hypothetical protein